MTDVRHIHDPLIRTLIAPAIWPHPAVTVELVETHISYVFLVGEYAYKIKKPLDLGFLDFSTLELRHHFCQEELRINRRLAPAIYLEVVAIAGSAESPRIGGQGSPIEYAVKMRRFPDDGLLSQHLEHLTPGLVNAIARRAAGFHESAEICGAEQPWGSADFVVRPMLENFEPIHKLEHDPLVDAQLQRLRQWTVQRHSELRSKLEERKAAGFVRECHGDMHLGNITLVEGEPVIFDAIEFNPGLRWIDTINEIAFLVMDLEEKQRPELAQLALNSYLEESGDYAGLKLLRFYQVYRAMVRAKVTAIRLGQDDLEQEERRILKQEFQRYLDLAERYTEPQAPALIITHGPSGSGKSVAARNLVQSLGAIQVRSDVERKRLAGLPPLARTEPDIGGDIYTAETTDQTYGSLLEAAEQILDAGFIALADATFLQRRQRRPFAQLADCLGVKFLILDMQTPEQLMRERLRIRAEQGGDPSEADEKVLDLQLKSAEPLTDEEAEVVYAVVPDQPLEEVGARLGATIFGTETGSVDSC
jgi:aminoglycoside phosphotransferase family enzyme/adenylate kinase family enzyme